MKHNSTNSQKKDNLFFHGIVVSSGVLAFGLPLPFIACSILYLLFIDQKVTIPTKYFSQFLFFIASTILSLVFFEIRFPSNIYAYKDASLDILRLILLWVSVYLNIIASKVLYTASCQHGLLWISKLFFQAFGILAGSQLILMLFLFNTNSIEFVLNSQGNFFVGTSAMSIFMIIALVFRLIAQKQNKYLTIDCYGWSYYALYIPAFLWAFLFDSRLSIISMAVLLVIDIYSSFNFFFQVYKISHLIFPGVFAIVLCLSPFYLDYYINSAFPIPLSLVNSFQPDSDQDRKDAVLIPLKCNLSLFGNGTFKSRHIETICRDIDTSHWSKSNPVFTIANLPSMLFEQGIVFTAIFSGCSALAWRSYMICIGLTNQTLALGVLFTSLFNLIINLTSSSYYMFPIYFLAFPYCLDQAKKPSL